MLCALLFAVALRNDRAHCGALNVADARQCLTASPHARPPQLAAADSVFPPAHRAAWVLPLRGTRANGGPPADAHR